MPQLDSPYQHGYQKGSCGKQRQKEDVSQHQKVRNNWSQQLHQDRAHNYKDGEYCDDGVRWYRIQWLPHEASMADVRDKGIVKSDELEIGRILWTAPHV